MEGSLRENVQYISKGVGRHDLGKMRRARNGEDRTDWNRSMTLQGAQTADGVTLARDHSKSAENISAATRDVLEGGHAGDRDAAERIATGMGGSETYGTLGNQEEIQSVGTIRTNNRVPGRTIGQEGRIEADGTINLRDVHESVDETYGSRARGRTPDPRDPDVQPPDADGNPT